LTRHEALAELQALVVGLPAGTLEERVAKAAERLAVHGAADVLRDVLVELAIEHLVEAAGRCPL
jgi:hypothetical protein